MALTPEEIHNKTFTSTKFKAGYDLDEVDDFLDEVELTVSELVSQIADLQSATRGEIPASVTAKIDELTAQNESLSAQLAQALADAETLRNQNAELASASSQGDSSVVDQLNNQLAQAQAEVSQLHGTLTELEAAKNQLEQRKVELEDQVAQLQAQNEELAQGTAVATMSSGDASTAAVRLLEIAQRTADETLSSARVESEQMLASASSEADRLLVETNNEIANITAQFETQKARFELKIEELRAYEREYRGIMRGFLEGQLQELDNKGAEIELIGGPNSDPEEDSDYEQ